jgi:hypothetical protein
MIVVLFACDDPRTSWFFQLVAGLGFPLLRVIQKVERVEEATSSECVSNYLLQTRCTWATGDIMPLETGVFSSQFVPIHSPLISSIVDFVCNSYQSHNNYSSFTVWSPRGSELVAKFFLSGRLFFDQLWCVLPESANVCVPPRCFQLFEQRRFILVVSIS